MPTKLISSRKVVTFAKNKFYRLMAIVRCNKKGGSSKRTFILSSLNIIFILFLCFSKSEAQNSPKCPDTVSINTNLTFFGFSYNEIDSLTVKIYKKGSAYKLCIDSFKVGSNNFVADTIRMARFIDIDPKHKITNKVDWSIKLKKGLVYKISDVNTDIVVLRHSFKRCQMVSFQLNGILKKSPVIEIVKPGFKVPKIRKNKVTGEDGRHQIY